MYSTQKTSSNSLLKRDTSVKSKSLVHVSMKLNQEPKKNCNNPMTNLSNDSNSSNKTDNKAINNKPVTTQNRDIIMDL